MNGEDKNSKYTIIFKCRNMLMLTFVRIMLRTLNITIVGISYATLNIYARIEKRFKINE